MANEETKLWDDVWNKNIESIEQVYLEIKNSLNNSIALQLLKTHILKRFNQIDGLKVIEIGAGYGRTAAKLGLLGADITLLDNSLEAKKFAEELYKKLQIPLNYYTINLFNIPEDIQKKLFNKFDICISFGLNEHFDEDKRKEIWYIHQKFLKEKGLAIVEVPNANCILYRLWKFFAERFNAWEVGFEKPFTISEITKILGYKPEYFGWSFYGTINLYIFDKISRVIYNLIHYHSLRRGKNPEGKINLIGFKLKRSILDNYQSGSYVIFYNK